MRENTGDSKSGSAAAGWWRRKHDDPAERKASQGESPVRSPRNTSDPRGDERRDKQPSRKLSKSEREAQNRRESRKREAEKIRERVLEERRKEKLHGVERPKQDADDLRIALKKIREQQARQRARQEAETSEERPQDSRVRGFERRSANPRIPHELPTERLEPLEQAHILRELDDAYLIDEAGSATSRQEIPNTEASEQHLEPTRLGLEQPRSASDLENLDSARPAGVAEQHAETTSVPIERATASPNAQREMLPGSEADDTTSVTRVPVERKVIVVRAPKGWPRIVLSAVEVAFLSWALVVATSLIAFLATAENPWMLDTDWNSAISVGTDVWAMSYGAPISVGGAVYKMIPLGLSVAHILLARLGLKRARAASWQGSALFIPAYLATVALLMLFSTMTASAGWLLLGAFTVVAIAWVWSLKSWDWDLARFAKIVPYARGARDGLIATSFLAILGLGVAVVGIVSAWDRVLGIQELLNGSAFDLVIVWIAQLLYLPNVAAWGAAWLTGPGFYTGSDAIVTPSRADISAIPAIPVLGALPQTEIGMWVVLIPIGVGVAFGLLLAWKRRETALTDHLIHAGFIAITMLVLVAIWMWLSTGSLGIDRMGILGPRWVYAVTFATLEVGLMAAVVYALAHPFLLAKYVEGGKAAKASAVHAASVGAQKIKSRKDGSSEGEDASAPLETEEVAGIDEQEAGADDSAESVEASGILIDEVDPSRESLASEEASDAELLAMLYDEDEDAASASTSDQEESPDADSGSEEGGADESLVADQEVTESSGEAEAAESSTSSEAPAEDRAETADRARAQEEQPDNPGEAPASPEDEQRS